MRVDRERFEMFESPRKAETLEKKLRAIFLLNSIIKASTISKVVNSKMNPLFPKPLSDKFSSTDWDKAWSSFKKQGKKSLFSQFTPNKYVSWNPRRSNYPLSEEVDPIKRAERSNLRLWTSPGFTLGGAIVIVTFLLIYTILYPIS